VGDRAALYLRVSNREQTVENQERELRAWAERLGLERIVVYSETASGAKTERAQLAALLAAAHRREFDVLLVWALDRLSREGIGPMVRTMEQLRTASVRVLSHQEPWLDTVSPTAELLLAVFAWVAKQERERIAERVRAGIARARAHGVRLGRPRRAVDVAAVRERRARGESWRKIARALRASLLLHLRRCAKIPFGD
jgi:DNA invertase Pin-like site-specific DNA recombinase